MIKTIIIPGGFQYVKNYGYLGLDIWLGGEYAKPPQADYFVGHSIGASLALTFFENNSNSKFILINPLVRKRNILSLFYRWIKFYIFEGIEWKKIVPAKYWLIGFGIIIKLLKIDVLGNIEKMPKDNLIIIRGKRDYFFCDEESVELIKKNDINLVEVDAGHDWNENIAKAVKNIISNNS